MNFLLINFRESITEITKMHFQSGRYNLLPSATLDSFICRLRLTDRQNLIHRERENVLRNASISHCRDQKCKNCQNQKNERNDQRLTKDSLLPWTCNTWSSPSTNSTQFELENYSQIGDIFTATKGNDYQKRKEPWEMARKTRIWLWYLRQEILSQIGRRSS